MFTFTPPDEGRVLNHDKQQRCNLCSPPQFVSYLLPTSLRPKQRTRPCELVHPGSHLCIFVSPKAFWDCINANTVSWSLTDYNLLLSHGTGSGAVEVELAEVVKMTSALPLIIIPLCIVAPKVKQIQRIVHIHTWPPDCLYGQSWCEKHVLRTSTQWHFLDDHLNFKMVKIAFFCFSGNRESYDNHCAGLSLILFSSSWNPCLKQLTWQQYYIIKGAYSNISSHLLKGKITTVAGKPQQSINASITFCVTFISGAVLVSQCKIVNSLKKMPI